MNKINKTELDNFSWGGSITIENIAPVCEALKRFLEGKRYTFTTVNHGYTTPEAQLDVRTSQQLKKTSTCTPYYGQNKDNPDKVSKDEVGPENADYAGVSIGDTYGVWGFSTDISSPDDEYYYDPDYYVPYVWFQNNKVQIIRRAPAGHILNWMIALERD